MISDGVLRYPKGILLIELEGSSPRAFSWLPTLAVAFTVYAGLGRARLELVGWKNKGADCIFPNRQRQAQPFSGVILDMKTKMVAVMIGFKLEKKVPYVLMNITKQ